MLWLHVYRLSRFARCYKDLLHILLLSAFLYALDKPYWFSLSGLQYFVVTTHMCSMGVPRNNFFIVVRLQKFLFLSSRKKELSVQIFTVNDYLTIYYTIRMYMNLVTPNII